MTTLVNRPLPAGVVAPAGRRRPLLTATVLLAVLLAGVVGSVGIGSSAADPLSSLAGLARLDDATILTIANVRLPRTVLGIAVGAALAVAGSLMQSLTRNPLASPQTFGVTAGASVAMVATIVYTPWTSTLGAFPALLGGVLGGVLVWSLASRGSLGLAALALAGMSVHLLLTALVQGMAVLNDASVDIVFWLAGSISGAQWNDVTLATPLIGLGVATAAVMGRQLSILALGPETATTFGQNYGLVSALVGALVVLLAGAAVAVSGPIGFVGLIVPHLIRLAAGHQERWSIPLCALSGATMVTTADVLGRVLFFPSEFPAGIVTALVGTPLFLVLVRRSRRTS
ncbi:FecCD family ABC transporter permease [Luethyella okanaganae]|uniref:FecCD family ABC transporter permease n=1 Tax=Luethyella okanaganae TaxID=69372 RepID=A0ABW1VBR2_9MICO